MKSFILSIFITVFLIHIGQAQDKFIFEIDDMPFLKITQNAGGFNTIWQSNQHTSMFFGFESGLNTIVDPMLFSSGELNTAYGYSTLAENTTGSSNTAMGFFALKDNTTGVANVAIGSNAMQGCITCFDNVGIGVSSLRINEEGAFNVAIGISALAATRNASRTTAIGSTAGVNDTSSVDNVYIGAGAGRGTVFETDGYDRKENVMVGSRSGYQNKTSGNVFLGFNSGYFSKADDQLYIANSDADSLNALIYGQFDNDFLRINGELNIDGLYSLPVSAPSTGQYLKYNGGATLEWADLSTPWKSGQAGDISYTIGEVGIGTDTPEYNLDVQGTENNGYIARFLNKDSNQGSNGIIIQTGVNTKPATSTYFISFLAGNGVSVGGITGNGAGGVMYTTTSDRRLKQNINPYDDGLSLIEKINPKIYQMKSNPDKEEIGFIAQELQVIMPSVVAGSPTGDPLKSPMTIDYGRLTPVLVSAIKEQQKTIDELSKKLLDQEKRFANLEAKIDQLQGLVKE